MSKSKTERLVNLTIALMSTRRPLTVAELGRLVEGYEPDDSDSGGDAFRRMFERDKEELRELGIPLQTEPVDPLYGDDVGYRIVRSDYALPEIALDPDEAAALGLAARLWSSAELARPADSALRKLAAAGADPREPPAGLEARVEAPDPSFGPLYDAVLARQEVTFPYRRPGQEVGTRRLQPWGLASWRGRWYVAGHDLDRDDKRVFRLSRVTGPVTAVGARGAYAIPGGLDVRALVAPAEQEDTAEPRRARLRITPGAAHRLRRDGTVVGADPDLLDVPFRSVDGFADVLAGHGPDVVVLAPADLRAAVVARLRGVLAASAA